MNINRRVSINEYQQICFPKRPWYLFISKVFFLIYKAIGWQIMKYRGSYQLIKVFQYLII